MDISRPLTTPTKSIFSDYLKRQNQSSTNQHFRTLGESKNEETKKILVDYIEQSKQRLSIIISKLGTTQFLNSRNRSSQELLSSIVSHTSINNKFYIPFNMNETKRKNKSLVSFEKQSPTSRIGNRRLQIIQTEQVFNEQIKNENREEYLNRMEEFLTEILTEEFREISQLFQAFMKQYHIFFDSYQLQLSVKENQLELKNQDEYERMHRNFLKSSTDYEASIKELNKNVEQLTIDTHKLHNEIQDQARKYKELRQKFDNKQREIDFKNKKIKSLECDIQSMQKKITYYENKLSQTYDKDQFLEIKQQVVDRVSKRPSISNFNQQPSGHTLTINTNTNIPIRKSARQISIINVLNTPQNNSPQELLRKKTGTQKSDSSLEQFEEENEDQDKLNQIELNYDRIVEYRTTEQQVELDILSLFQHDIEIQTHLTMIGENYDGLKQENIVNALKYTEFLKGVENNAEATADIKFEKVFEAVFSDIDELNLPSSGSLQPQQTITPANKRLSVLNKGSIIIDEQKSSKMKQNKEIQIKQLLSYFNYSKKRIQDMQEELDGKKIEIVTHQFAIEKLQKQNKELTEELTKLKLSQIDDKIQLQELKQKFEQTQTTTNDQQQQSLLGSQTIQHSNDHKQQKQTQQNQQKKGKQNRIPQLGQKVTVSYDFQKDQAKQLIQKVKSKNMQKFTNFLPLKAVLKYITTLYFDKIHNQKEQKGLKDQDMSAFIYNYYMQQFGYTKVTEQRFMILVLSIKKNIKLVRVNIFAKFMQLFEENQNYSPNEQQRYLEALEYVQNQQNLGITIKDNESEPRYFIPYVRALSYLSQLQQFNFSQEEFNYLKSEFEELKENDSKNQNKSGIIDFDLMMIRVLQIFRNNVEKTKAYVINAFAASDLDGNGMCNIDEWLLLNRHIEGDKFDEDKLIDAFEENADLIVEEEKNLSFETFSILCMSLELFSDAAQNKFLKVRNNQDVLTKFEQLQQIWSEEYTKCIQKLISVEMPEQEKQKWNTILSVLNEKVLSHPEQVKPLLIAYKIFQEEIK